MRTGTDLYIPKHQPSEYPELDRDSDGEGEPDEMHAIAYLISQVVCEQIEFLSAYGRTLDTMDINIKDVQHFLDMFWPRQVAVTKRI